MKIVQEIFEKENYIELCISPQEHEFIKEYMIISKKVSLDGVETNIGIKLELESEERYDDEEPW